MSVLLPQHIVTASGRRTLYVIHQQYFAHHRKSHFVRVGVAASVQLLQQLADTLGKGATGRVTVWGESPAVAC